jgi:hypothetical protein
MCWIHEPRQRNGPVSADVGEWGGPESIDGYWTEWGRTTVESGRGGPVDPPRWLP